MGKYEYKALVSAKPVNAKQLNEFGAEGWMLASVIRVKDEYLTYLMRKKPSD